MELTVGNIFVISLLLFLGGTGVIIYLLGLVLRYVSGVPDMSSRLWKMENIVEQISTTIQINHLENSMNDALNEQMEANARTPHGRTIYRSADGKHEASSVEELLLKIASDPGTGIDPNDVEALKRIFEQIGKEIEEDEEDEDEE